MILTDDGPSYHERLKLKELEDQIEFHKILYTPANGDNDGFYRFMCRHGTLPGAEWIKYFLGRLSRLDPNGNPRDMLEWLSVELYKYELHCRRRKKDHERRSLLGQRATRKRLSNKPEEE